MSEMLPGDAKQFVSPHERESALDLEAGQADHATGLTGSEIRDRNAHIEGAREALVVADSLTAGYIHGVNILNGCDLYAKSGELVGIIGPNGAGKSTLLKALFGLVRVRSGHVTLGGQDITNVRADQLVSMGIGFVPQTNNVFPSLTIQENLEMGGERQMVAMGRALMMDPSVLLLDEPSAGLSPALQDEVFVRVREINATGVTVIMVEQNARRCLQICDRGYVLDQGHNAYTGTGRALATDPKVIQLYLGTLAQA